MSIIQPNIIDQTQPILKYNGVELLNVPHASSVAQEVIIDDCYRIDTLPEKSFVIDIGGFYGEFALMAYHKGHRVWTFEPCKKSFKILSANLELNSARERVRAFNVGVGLKSEARSFIPNEAHPAGNRFRLEGQGDLLIPREQMEVVSMAKIVTMAVASAGDRPIFVKMDCEGMEKEIFQDHSWMHLIKGISMEWHDHDGESYRLPLMLNGFTVMLEGGGPPPRPAWDPSIGGGLLHGWRDYEQMKLDKLNEQNNDPRGIDQTLR